MWVFVKKNPPSFFVLIYFFPFFFLVLAKRFYGHWEDWLLYLDSRISIQLDLVRVKFPVV